METLTCELKDCKGYYPPPCYVSAVDAAFAGGGGSVGSSKGVIAVSDSEVSSVSGKNLIVIGGSCVNSVAAELLSVSSPACGADFTSTTGVNSGQWLIETFSRSGGKVATLVAGYNAQDTTNAANVLTTKDIDTTVGKKHTGSTSTAIESTIDVA